MIDPFGAGVFVTSAAAIFGMFLRIENRITKIESTLKQMQGERTGCQPRLEERMK